MKTTENLIDNIPNDYKARSAVSPSTPSTGRVILQRLKAFNTFWDSRFEDLTKETWVKTTYRDFSAGLIVALTAIPMAMGFAMAMGLRPEQGIIAGALACMIGRTWGGSKYQVYGPTAAFIPIIAALMAKYGEAGGGTFAEGHGFLVMVSLIAGIVLMLMGVFGLGKYAKLVPNSIIVGFTAGIAVAIAMSNFESILGIESFADLLGEDEDIKGGFLHNISAAYANIDKVNIWSVTLGLATFILTKGLLRISIFIPAPLIAIGVSTLLAATVMADKGVVLVRDIYGSIPNNFFVFTPPIMPTINAGVAIDIAYFVSAIVFVSAVESLLCSSMADRMADNRKTPFNPDKEFWGQGLVQVIVPMVNGFPCTGALARTATSIKAGAVTPLAGYFKGILKLALAYYIASYLEMVPMACIGGILLWVATNMIKISEIKEVLNHNKFHAGLMVYTAIMVPATDFLTGVLSALVIYFVTYRFLDKPAGETKRVERAAAPLSIEQPSIVSTPGCFHSVTVPLAMTEDDKGLLRYAARLAKLGIGKEFHFVHVITPNERKRNAASDKDLIRGMTEEVQSYFNGEFKHVKVDFQALEGPSRMDELVHLTLAAKSDLILLGHRNNRSGQRSLARRLAMITNCSVWMVPQESDAEITRIIAPIDFSLPSADSLSQATALARSNNIAECLALHVFFDESVIRYDEHQDIVRGEEAAAFAKFMTGIDTHGVTTKLASEESINVAHAILRKAGEYNADLIVIGTRGHSRAATILLGSVTSQVMAESKIPVLAIKHVDDRMTLMKALLSSRFIGHPDPKSN
ncbi:SulP family inorganic anion transporter [Methylobacter sp.]|uniref:SulP family inorganic anion transporter n=1 Tax=Methylobacter sp. TaxID=2051955 RepID=UPI0012109369|nr:SulP family inorganic anion transporter [Methylobacter sp.]TAK63200.1 MAG: sulfate transporter [Methylobacter sp.]